ncbi:MAG: hypothetical protein ACI9E1_001669 [Cryomorphaceae bacterium]|jgi:hypothetical protein
MISIIILIITLTETTTITVATLIIATIVITAATEITTYTIIVPVITITTAIIEVIVTPVATAAITTTGVLRVITKAITTAGHSIESEILSVIQTAADYRPPVHITLSSFLTAAHVAGPAQSALGGSAEQPALDQSHVTRGKFYLRENPPLLTLKP